MKYPSFQGKSIKCGQKIEVLEEESLNLIKKERQGKC